MVNIIVPVIDNVEEYSKALMSLNAKVDVNIVVGVTESLSSALNLPKHVILQVFQDGSKKEEIINALQSYVQDGKIIVARRAFSLKEFDSLNKSKSQITYCEIKEKNKFKSFMLNILKGLVKLLFGVKIFDGETSLIAFDEELSQVLLRVPNLSYCTRVDRWKGSSQEAFVSDFPSVEMEHDKNKNIMLIIYAVMSIIVPAVVTTMVALFANVNFIISILLFCFCFLGVAICVIFVCSFFFNKVVGNKNFDKAREL